MESSAGVIRKGCVSEGVREGGELKGHRGVGVSFGSGYAVVS